MTIDTARLRALAEAATPGPWSTEALRCERLVDIGVTQGEEDHEDYAFARGPATWRKAGDVWSGSWRKQAERDAAFIAAANPQTVIALLDEVERLDRALTKISAIRDSIVGMQGFNFSEHAYPLVAALDEAGYKGAGYEIARANLGTLIERNENLEAALREACEIADRLSNYVTKFPAEGGPTMADRRIAELRKLAGEP